MDRKIKLQPHFKLKKRESEHARIKFFFFSLGKFVDCNAMYKEGMFFFVEKFTEG